MAFPAFGDRRGGEEGVGGEEEEDDDDRAIKGMERKEKNKTREREMNHVRQEHADRRRRGREEP